MCANSCIAFTGPFASLEACPKCGDSHYNEDKTPKQELHTIPLGPQLHSFDTLRVPKTCHISENKPKKSSQNHNKIKESWSVSMTFFMAKITSRPSKMDVFKKTTLF